jgi:Spy/CpxP family protein refolding chaperone
MAVVAVIATMALAAASAVLAHPGPGMGMGPGFGPMGQMGGMPGGDLATMVQSRMDQLKSELKITSTQEPAWQAFAGKAKQQAQAMQAQRAKVQPTELTVPDRMAQRSEFMKLRVDNMASMNTAMKELYAALTPEQKRIADQRFGQGGGHRMPFGPRGG